MPVAIPFEEQFGADHSRAIEDEGTWIGHAYRPALRSLIADVVGVDRPALGVREQGEGDLLAVGELLEGRWWIIADADDLDACGFDRLEIALQLDQLPTAERSPVGRAEEHQRDVILLEQLVERALPAVLVLEGKPGGLL